VLPAQTFDRGTVGVEQRELHVLQGAGSWQKMKRLEDKADLLVSNAGLIVYAQARDILPIEEVAPNAGLIKGARECSSSWTCPIPRCLRSR